MWRTDPSRMMLSENQHSVQPAPTNEAFVRLLRMLASIPILIPWMGFSVTKTGPFPR